MRNFVRLVTLLGLLLSQSLSAKTLIVTHADSHYDEGSDAGPATRALFEDPSFSRKLLLITDGGEKRFTFDVSGLSFESVYSKGGEIRWDDSDSELVIAGGYWQACFYNTIWDVITQSKRDLKISVPMAATYSLATYLNLNPWADKTLPSVTNLEKLEQLSGTKVIEKKLAELLDGLHTKHTQGIRFTVRLRGRVIAQIGLGSRIVDIDFL